MLDEWEDIHNRYAAAAQTGDVSYGRTTSGSLELDASNLLTRFNDLHEPPCATELASTISLSIANMIKGLSAVKAGDFDEGATYFNEYNRLIGVATAQLQQLQREMD
jgi:hypothetical protein